METLILYLMPAPKYSSFINTAANPKKIGQGFNPPGFLQNKFETLYYFIAQKSRLILSHQAFVLMKTSFAFVFRILLQGVLIKTKIFTLVLRLQKTSSRRLAQGQYIRLGHTSSRRLQDVLKMSSKRLEDVFARRLQGVLKTYSRRLQDIFQTSSKRLRDVLQNRLQDIFKTSCKDTFKTFSVHIIKLNCSCQQGFETYSTRF